MRSSRWAAVLSAALTLLLLVPVAQGLNVGTSAASGIGFCDFNPTWPNSPTYQGQIVPFMVSVLEWIALAVGSLIFDLVGALAVGLACFAYAALIAPSQFLYGVFLGSVPAFAAYGIFGGLLGTLVIVASITILVLALVFLYGIIGDQAEIDADKLTGRTPPATLPQGELEEAAEEL